MILNILETINFDQFSKIWNPSCKLKIFYRFQLSFFLFSSFHMQQLSEVLKFKNEKFYFFLPFPFCNLFHTKHVTFLLRKQIQNCAENFDYGKFPNFISHVHLVYEPKGKKIEYSIKSSSSSVLQYLNRTAQSSHFQVYVLYIHLPILYLFVLVRVS